MTPKLVEHQPCACGETLTMFAHDKDGKTVWQCAGCWKLSQNAQTIFINMNKKAGEEDEVQSPTRD